MVWLWGVSVWVGTLGSGVVSRVDDVVLVGGLSQGGWGGVILYMCVYLYIVLGGYLRILGAPIVQSCCILSISAS